MQNAFLETLLQNWHKMGMQMNRRKNIRDDILFDVARKADLNFTFLVFMGTSGILTTTALVTNSVPVLIGAMVIAPIMPPLQLVAFALVGGRWRLAMRGLGTAFLGLLVAVIFTFITGWLLDRLGIIEGFGNEIYKPLLEERVRPGSYSLIVAIAAGFSGTLAIAEQKVDTLVGVVSAVALVPAAGAGAISVLAGDMGRALGGFSLFAINFLLILGVAIITLTLFGRFVEKKDAR